MNHDYNNADYNTETNTISILQSNKKIRKCMNYPVCTSIAKDCGGWKRAYCQHFFNNNLTAPDLDAFKYLKR